MTSENTVAPPPGWTTDPEELDYEGEWATPDTWGYQLAADHGLGKCTPIMCDPQVGELIFEADGKFYEISQIGAGLFLITSRIR